MGRMLLATAMLAAWAGAASAQDAVIVGMDEADQDVLACLQGDPKNDLKEGLRTLMILALQNEDQRAIQSAALGFGTSIAQHTINSCGRDMAYVQSAEFGATINVFGQILGAELLGEALGGIN